MSKTPTANSRATLMKILEWANFEPLKKDLGGRMHGCCPIHGGDNPNGFTAYLAGNEPFFVCWTKGCTVTAKSDSGGPSQGCSAFSFVRLVMARRSDRHVSAEEAAKKVLEIAGDPDIPEAEEPETESQSDMLQRLATTARVNVAANLMTDSLKQRIVNMPGFTLDVSQDANSDAILLEGVYKDGPTETILLHPDQAEKVAHFLLYLANRRR